MYFFLLGLGLAMTSLIFWFSSSVQHPWRLGLATRMLSGNCSNATKQRRKAARLDKDARIAIIGSGLGGLSAAISLEQAGFTNVVVYERHVSPCSRREGYGLTLTYNPKGPLAQMGLLDQVAQQDCPSRSHYIFSPDGSILGYYGNEFLPNRGKGQRGNMRVPRLVLRQLMLDRVKSPVHWGNRLITFEPGTENIRLQFDNDTTTEVDLLVGADGIRSSVVQRLEQENGLRYLSIMIILGIADFLHPLLDERGFYTLDGTHRLFTMPYEGSKLSTKRRTMWQLSYRLHDEQEAKRLSAAGPEALREEVLRRCHNWHQPVPDMIAATPLETIWGTGLVDRDPHELLKKIDTSCRVVVLGDAVHSMSPFKGQGANQALTDGPLLASWLQKASIDSAVKGFWREMVQRTASKVKASREAAALLHSPLILEETNDFAGVKPDCIKDLLVVLEKRGIGANKGGKLDELVYDTIDDLDFGTLCETPVEQAQEQHCKQALILAAHGNSIGLRNLSLQHSDAICLARDEQGRTCLHLATIGGHYQTCRWLLTEALVSPDTVDEEKKTPLQVAIELGQEDIAALLSIRLENKNAAVCAS